MRGEVYRKGEERTIEDRNGEIDGRREERNERWTGEERKGEDRRGQER